MCVFAMLPPPPNLPWPACRPGHTGFNTAERKLWKDQAFGDLVLGYLKSHKRLTHLIVRNAGHMVSGGGG